MMLSLVVHILHTKFGELELKKFYLFQLFLLFSSFYPSTTAESFSNILTTEWVDGEMRFGEECCWERVKKGLRLYFDISPCDDFFFEFSNVHFISTSQRCVSRRWHRSSSSTAIIEPHRNRLPNVRINLFHDTHTWGRLAGGMGGK